MKIRNMLTCGSLASLFVATAPLSFTACGDEGPAPAGETTDTTDTVDSIDTTDTSPPADVDAPSDTTPDGGDVVDVPETNAVFLAGMNHGQSILAGAFPNDTLRDDDGVIELASLADDPGFKPLASQPLLKSFDKLVATRTGFSFTSAALFPMAVAPDLATFADRVEFISLAGADSGARFPAQVDWFEKAGVLVALPAWGHAMVPGSTYGIIISVGVKDSQGRTLVAPPAIRDALVAAEPGMPTPDGARARANPTWTLLRAAVASPEDVVMATAFTTEESLPWLRAFFDAADTFELAVPRSNVGTASDTELTWVPGLDLHGAALSAHFGTPSGTFAFFPTHWTAGSRAGAASLDTETSPYDGGAYHGRVGRLVQGGLVMPSFALKAEGRNAISAAPTWAEGRPVAHTRTLVPFSAYLCTTHMSDTTAGTMRDDISIPFAIFTHGGTEIRAQALSFAVSNCENGVATIVLDLPFHGGRQSQRFFTSEDLIVPVHADVFNAYNGLAEPDGIGDAGGATTSVGGLFGLPVNFDPIVIETNLASIAVESHVLTRYLRDEGPNGLGAFLGVDIAAEKLMMQSLSFGSNFTVGQWALDPTISHIVTSVGSGYVLSVNLPMAPANAGLVTSILDLTLGLAENGAYLASGAWRDPAISLLQWFCERGDPLAYAPFVLRYRTDGHTPSVLATGNSWDETLFGPAQISLNNALGLPVFADAASGWRLDPAMPGAAAITEAPFPTTAIAANATFGDRTATAGLFYNSASCHAHITAPFCETAFESDYPPAVPRDDSLFFLSPICAVHDLVIGFGASFTDPETPASFSAPRGATCQNLFDRR